MSSILHWNHELEGREFNEDTKSSYIQVFLEILSAYDKTKDEKYYDVAKLISDKLSTISPEDVFLKINQLQLVKRKRALSENELQELEHIGEGSDDKMIICAVDILLDNKRRAKKELDEMPDKEIFMTFPICNLL